MPALRRALILAYRPGLELFISPIVSHIPPHHHALAGMGGEPPMPCHLFSGPASLKFHYGTPQVKGRGRIKESPSPGSFVVHGSFIL